MLKRTYLRPALPKGPAMRKKKQANHAPKSTVTILPTSAGGWFFKILSPYLPITWRYGWRFRCLQALWVLVTGSFAVVLAKTMFIAEEEEVAKKAAKFSYVRDDNGTVVDISYKPLIDAGMRAKRRTQRLREDEEEDKEEQEVLPPK